MVKFIPMIRTNHLFNPALRNQLMSMFEGREKSLPAFEKKDKIVLIKFRRLPNMKSFRWGKQWWRKTSFKGGSMQGHEFEIPAEDLVGVYLKNLDNETRQYIEKKEDVLK